MLCGFFRVVNGMQVMTMRDVGVMAGLFRVAACVMFGRFFMMPGRVFMMLSSFDMMFCAFFTHKEITEDYWNLGGFSRVSNLSIILVLASKRSK
jgi:hypothetical protein